MAACAKCGFASQGQNRCDRCGASLVVPSKVPDPGRPLSPAQGGWNLTRLNQHGGKVIGVLVFMLFGVLMWCNPDGGGLDQGGGGRRTGLQALMLLLWGRPFGTVLLVGGFLYLRKLVLTPAAFDEPASPARPAARRGMGAFTYVLIILLVVVIALCAVLVQNHH
jgi:hypothetical protein